MIFRKAEKEDFYKIRSLYWNLIDQEQDDPSFPHWKKEIHPSDEMILDSIDKGGLYVLADGGEIVACVIANDEKVEGYADAPWQIDSDEVIVLHVLAVHPDYRGKGLARKLVENKNNLKLNKINRTKEAYGRYQNVFLENYSKLKIEIAELDALVEELSAYMQSTGRKYADHAATLRSWSARKKRQQKPGTGIPDYTYNEEESL